MKYANKRLKTSNGIKFPIENTIVALTEFQKSDEANRYW